MKARLTHKENSKAGWKGVLKKLAYWIMIAVAFGASAVFVELGKTLGIDLGITTLLGFFVLASLLVNEIRSICENLVEISSQLFCLVYGHIIIRLWVHTDFNIDAV